jgi:hypothetical protein
MELIELTYKKPIKELRLEITTDTVVAEHRKLKARWEMQMQEDTYFLSIFNNWRLRIDWKK